MFQDSYVTTHRCYKEYGFMHRRIAALDGQSPLKGVPFTPSALPGPHLGDGVHTSLEHTTLFAGLLFR